MEEAVKMETYKKNSLNGLDILSLMGRYDLTKIGLIEV